MSEKNDSNQYRIFHEGATYSHSYCIYDPWRRVGHINANQPERYDSKSRKNHEQDNVYTINHISV